MAESGTTFHQSVVLNLMANTQSPAELDSLVPRTCPQPTESWR
jgi:hypothetical protein